MAKVILFPISLASPSTISVMISLSPGKTQDLSKDITLRRPPVQITVVVLKNINPVLSTILSKLFKINAGERQSPNNIELSVDSASLAISLKQ